MLDSYFIPYKNGGGTVVDWDFTNPIHCLTWCNNGSGYAISGIRVGTKHKTIRMHRMLTNFSDNQVDHINRKRNDNRKINLRLVTNRENHNNRSWHGLWPPGVRYHKGSRFMVNIQINGKRGYYGYYPDPMSPKIIYDFIKEELDATKM